MSSALRCGEPELPGWESHLFLKLFHPCLPGRLLQILSPLIPRRRQQHPNLSVLHAL